MQRAMRYETNTRTIEPYDVQPTRDSRDNDSEARGRAAIMLEDLDAAGITCARPDDPSFVAGLHKVSKELGRLGPQRARADAFDPVDDMLGGDPFEPHLDASSDEFSSYDDGSGEVVSGEDAQQRMLETQRNAWKTRRGAARPGAVDDPQPAPFGSASRASTGAAQRTIDPQTYAPRERYEEHGEGALGGATSGTGYGGFGAAEGMPGDDGEGEGTIADAQGAMVAKQKDAWKPGMRKRDRSLRSDGLLAGDVSDDGSAAMLQRQKDAGLQPLRRRGLP